MAARKSSEIPETASSTVTPAFTRKTAPAAPVKTEKAALAGLPVETDDTVCVALNRPLGVYFRMPDGRKVTLNGNGAPLIGKEKGVLPVGAYGLTVIKKSDWEYILKTYGNGKLFKNGLLFATSSRAESEKEADSRDDLRNGLEPVDPARTATTEAKGE